MDMTRVDAVLEAIGAVLSEHGRDRPEAPSHPLPRHVEQLEAAMSRTVRAKMYVLEVAKTTWGGRVKLQVVSRGQDNKEWASATPSGTLELTIRNDHALAQFEPGDEVFVDISPAPKGEEGMGD